jgi:hypothetical protein
MSLQFVRTLNSPSFVREGNVLFRLGIITFQCLSDSNYSISDTWDETYGTEGLTRARASSDVNSWVLTQFGLFINKRVYSIAAVSLLLGTVDGQHLSYSCPIHAEFQQVPNRLIGPCHVLSMFAYFWYRSRLIRSICRFNKILFLWEINETHRQSTHLLRVCD